MTTPAEQWWMLPDHSLDLAAPSVELAEWEQHKENVRPLRCGRSAAILSEMAQKASGKVEESGALEKQAAQFETLVAASSARFDDTVRAADSLEAQQHAELWFRYANWAAEHFPSGSRQERQVLERATKELAELPECADSEQHLEMWLRLADLHREPQDIFNFLWSRSIGAGRASFYEAWARSLERQRRFAEAEEAVEVGLARKAEPVERLVSFRQALTSRMCMRISDSMTAADTPPGAFGAPVPQPERPTLNDITEREARQLHRPLSRRQQQGSLSQQSAQGTNADQQFQCLDMSDELRTSSIFDSQASWVLPPAFEAEGAKENSMVPTAQPWTTSRLRQRVPARPAPRLPVFVDSDFAAAAPAPTVSSRPLDSGNPDVEDLIRRRHHGAADLRADLRERRRERTPRVSEDDLVAGLSDLRLGHPAKRSRMGANTENVPDTVRVGVARSRHPSALDAPLGSGAGLGLGSTRSSRNSSFAVYED